MSRTRRSLLSVLAAAALVAGAIMLPSSPAVAAQLITNGDFETGSLAPWSCSLGSVVSSPVHGGTHALQGAANNSDDAQCTQTVSVVSGTSYTLSAYVQRNYVFLG